MTLILLPPSDDTKPTLCPVCQAALARAIAEHPASHHLSSPLTLLKDDQSRRSPTVIELDAENPKIGLTLGELANFYRQAKLLGVKNNEPVFATTGFRSQVRTLRVKDQP